MRAEDWIRGASEEERDAMARELARRGHNAEPLQWHQASVINMRRSVDETHDRWGRVGRHAGPIVTKHEVRFEVEGHHITTTIEQGVMAESFDVWEVCVRPKGDV